MLAGAADVVTDPAAAHRVAVAEALERSWRGWPWDRAALRLAVGERLDTLTARCGVRRRHAGGWLGRETDADLIARAERAETGRS